MSESETLLEYIFPQLMERMENPGVDFKLARKFYNVMTRLPPRMLEYMDFYFLYGHRDGKFSSLTFRCSTDHPSLHFTIQEVLESGAAQPVWWNLDISVPDNTRLSRHDADSRFTQNMMGDLERALETVMSEAESVIWYRPSLEVHEGDC